MSIQSISNQSPPPSRPPTAGSSTPASPSTALPSAATTAAAPTVKSEAVDAKQLADAVAQVQGFTQSLAKDLTFSIDEDSGKTVVKIIDSSTKEVIRQIPSEEMLGIAQALDKIQGLLIKQKA